MVRACVCLLPSLAQTSFFFGYMGIAAFGVALMLGFVGFYSSLRFVKKIYSSIKVE